MLIRSLILDPKSRSCHLMVNRLYCLCQTKVTLGYKELVNVTVLCDRHSKSTLVAVIVSESTTNLLGLKNA